MTPPSTICVPLAAAGRLEINGGKDIRLPPPSGSGGGLAGASGGNGLLLRYSKSVLL
jgi:hypothetical protein